MTRPRCETRKPGRGSSWRSSAGSWCLGGSIGGCDDLVGGVGERGEIGGAGGESGD